MFKDLTNITIAAQRTRVMQCSAEDLAILKLKFIESLCEREQRFYAPKLDHPRLPTMFIVFAYPLITQAEAGAVR